MANQPQAPRRVALFVVKLARILPSFGHRDWVHCRIRSAAPSPAVPKRKRQSFREDQMNLLRLMPSLVVAAILSMAAAAPAAAQNDETFSQNEVVQAASDFFGTTTAAVAKAVERIFAEQGLPDAYIKGEEGSGAIVVGLRYGSGWLIRKHTAPMKVYWQGPPIRFDLGGDGPQALGLV